MKKLFFFALMMAFLFTTAVADEEDPPPLGKAATINIITEPPNSEVFLGGEPTLLPTSRTAELFAPAFKKYIRVTTNDREVLNTGVIDGSVERIPLTLEAGKQYKIEYQAVDYNGVVRVRNYTIKAY